MNIILIIKKNIGTVCKLTNDTLSMVAKMTFGQNYDTFLGVNKSSDHKQTLCMNSIIEILTRRNRREGQTDRVIRIYPLQTLYMGV